MAGRSFQDNLYILERYMPIEFISAGFFECLEEISSNMEYDLPLEDRKKMLNFFVRNAQNKHITHSDLFPFFADLYIKALSNENPDEAVSPEEARSYARAMFHKNPKFMIKAAPQILSKAPYLAETVYDCLGDFPKNSPNESYSYCRVLESVYFAAEPEFAYKMLKDIYENPENKELQDKFFPFLGSIYKDQNKTALQSYIFSLMNRDQSRKSEYYKNLKSALAQGANPQEILECLDKGIDKASEPGALLIAYNMLGKEIPEKAPELKQKALSVIERASLRNRYNDKSTLKKANLYLEKWEELRGGAIIGQRVEKSEQYPLGWKKDIKINNQKPSVLCLGGDGALDDQSANGYARAVEDLLKNKGLKDQADIYAASYDFGYNEGEYLLGSNSGRSRSQMFLEHKHLKEIKGYLQPTAEDKNPKYVSDLFEKFLLPRISKNDGKERLSAEEASRNIRNLQIIAHCHGAYTALKMEEMMQKKMADLGYSKEERKAIQKQLLVVAQSPYCPLGVSKSTFISFCSAKDSELNHHNHFNDTIWEINQEQNIRLSYFDEKKGNLFLVSTTGIGEYAPDEHNYWGLVPREGQDKDFIAMLRMEGNIIASGIKNAMENGKIPTTKQLVCQDTIGEELFERAAANGRDLYEQIVKKSKNNARVARIAKKFGPMEW